MSRIPEKLKLNRFQEVRIPRKSEYLKALMTNNAKLDDNGGYDEEHARPEQTDKVGAIVQQKRRIEQSMHDSD